MSRPSSPTMLGLLTNVMASSPTTERRGGGREEGALFGEGVECAPVLCQLIGSWGVIVPAVRFTHEAGVGLFPLSKAELGEVWHLAVQIGRWQVSEVLGGWDEFAIECDRRLRYPRAFWEEIIRVLRCGRFRDGSPISWTRWADVCRYPNDQLHVAGWCGVCGLSVPMPIRWIYDPQAPIDAPKCSDVGRQCTVSPLTLPVVKPEPLSHVPLTASAQSPAGTHHSSPFRNAHFGLGQAAPDGHGAKEKSSPPRVEEIVEEEAERKTWSQIRQEMGMKGKEEEVRWVEERELDPFATITPDPMNYVVGTPVTRFMAADPSSDDIAQFERLKREGKWQGMLREFMKWAATPQGARFDGEEDVAAVVKWDDALQFHFQITGWANPIACAVAATATFQGKARSWWRAHFGRHPQLVIGYPQLVEWVKRELVPRADLGTSCVVWADLQFKGDVDGFLKELDQLMTFHPLKHDSMIRMSSRPFGAAFVSKAVSADAQFGARGMSYPQLRKLIQNHVLANPHLHRPTRQGGYPGHTRFQPNYHSRLQMPAPSLGQAHAVSEAPPKWGGTVARNSLPPPATTPKPHFGDRSFPVVDRPAPPQVGLSKQLKLGTGPAPCYVCGSDQHPWLRCPKKRMGKCGCCGSEDHWTRACSQRFHPAPHMRMNFQALCEAASEDASLFLENAPYEEDEKEEAEHAHSGAEEQGEEVMAVACSLRLEPINPPQLCNVTALPEVQQEDEDMEVIGRRPQRETNGSSPWCNSTLGRLLPKMGDQGMGAAFSLKGFYRRITTCLHPPLKPLQPPSQAGQLYDEVYIEGSPIRALLDPGASHSFIWEEWARTQSLTYTPLDPPRTVGVFNGGKGVCQICRACQEVWDCWPCSTLELLRDRAIPHTDCHRA